MLLLLHYKPLYSAEELPRPTPIAKKLECNGRACETCSMHSHFRHYLSYESHKPSTYTRPKYMNELLANVMINPLPACDRKLFPPSRKHDTQRIEQLNTPLILVVHQIYTLQYRNSSYSLIEKLQ